MTGPAQRAQIRCSQLIRIPPVGARRGHFSGVGRSKPVSPLDCPLAKPDTPLAKREGRAAAGLRSQRPHSVERSDGPVIHFDNVTKTYPNQGRPALENVTI